MKYYLDVISLEGCPYSREVEILLKEHNLTYKLHRVSQEEKQQYKTREINTFPQIYLKNNTSKGKLLLGGNSDLKEILELKGSNFDNQKNYLTRKYPNFSEKVILRIIELFANKEY